MRIELCGRLAVERDGVRLEGDLPGRQGRLLFAYLVLNRDRPVTRDELMASLWWDRAPSATDSALSALLSRLRRALGPGVLEGRSELDLVLPEGTWIDVDAAEEGVARAEAAIAEGRFKDAWAPAGVTLNLADRGLLPGHDAPWLDEARSRLDALTLRALDCMARVGLGVGGGELAAAERAAHRLIECEPYRESGYRHLMEVLDARGDVAEALRVYERLRRLLRDELGTAPAPALQALHARLLHRGDSPAAPGA